MKKKEKKGRSKRTCETYTAMYTSDYETIFSLEKNLAAARVTF